MCSSLFHFGCIVTLVLYLCSNSDFADQSHHYRAIIEILKPEKGHEEESDLDSLLRSQSPADATKDASMEKVGSWLL